MNHSKEALVTDSSKQLVLVLSKLIIIVFICFFSFGASIAVIPIYIKTDLQFGGFVIGIIIALQYLTTLLSRSFSGTSADTIGAKITVSRGLLTAIGCGVMYLGCGYSQYPIVQLLFIAGGRVLLGIAESLIVTGSLTWALNRAGNAHAGKIMAWNGNAMYGGIALGALAGSWLVTEGGFLWIAYAAAVLPAIAWMFANTLEVQIPSRNTRLPFYKVIYSIMLPGLGLLLSTVGYGVILSYIGLFFHENHWQGSEKAIACFGASYVLARLLFSHFPDRFGGARVAFFSLLVEFIGQSLIFFAEQKGMVFIGASLTGFGFSLVVPSLGIEAIKRTPTQNRGAAMGGFLAFFDLSFCIMIPLAGALAKGTDYHIVFFIGALSSFISGLIAWGLRD